MTYWTRVHLSGFLGAVAIACAVIGVAVEQARLILVVAVAAGFFSGRLRGGL